MQSEFNVLCKAAREQIDVPAIPLAAIRSAATMPAASASNKGRKGLAATLIAGLSIVTFAAAAEIWSGTHVTLTHSGHVTIQLPKDGIHVRKANPTSQDVRAAARQAAFPVTLPAGLPEGTTPISLVYNANLIQLQYNLPGGWRASNHILWIVLADPRTLTPATTTNTDYQFMHGGTAAKGATRWLVGHELVIMPHSTLTPAELANLKSAMLARAQHQ